MSQNFDIETLQNIDNHHLKSFTKIFLDVRKELFNIEKLNTRILNDASVLTILYSSDIFKIKQELKRVNDVISSVDRKLSSTCVL